MLDFSYRMRTDIPKLISRCALFFEDLNYLSCESSDNFFWQKYFPHRAAWRRKLSLKCLCQLVLSNNVVKREEREKSFLPKINFLCSVKGKKLALTALFSETRKNH